MKLAILIPAFNEQTTIGKVLDDLKKLSFKNIEKEIIVINDGSNDKTVEEAQKRKVTVISHVINRGLGGALGTGITYAKSTSADYVVTIDADGQHNPNDLPQLLKPLFLKKADVVIGSRLIDKSGMPIDRKLINLLANLVNFMLWGIWISDSQSGLRAFSQKAIEKIDIKMNKMEVSSEFLKEAAKYNLKIKEIPIKAIYSEYSRNKGQKNTNALNIFAKLLMERLLSR